MKKARIVLLVVVLALIGVFVWLLGGANPNNLDRQDVIVDVADTFER